MDMIDESKLFPPLLDPVLHSMNFLNEIMDKYPDAISFAPGTPNPSHVAEIGIQQSIDCFVQYLKGKKIVDSSIQKTLYQYGPASGIINELIATVLLKDKQINVPVESIIVTVGAQEAMTLILRALFNTSSDTLAIVDPSYVGIIGAAKLANLEIIGIPENEGGVDIAALEDACLKAKYLGKPIRAFYCAPDYANPSGTLTNLNTRYELLRLANQYDFYIIEDSTYGFTAMPENALPTLKAIDTSCRVLLIGSFSKICFPGARVGYVVADQLVRKSSNQTYSLASVITQIKSMITVNTSSISQAIIGGIILKNNYSLMSIEQEKAKTYQKNLQLLLKTLDEVIIDQNNLAGISWNHPKGGFFVCMNLPVKTNLSLLEYSAGHYGVIWMPMSVFYTSNKGDKKLRLSCSYLAPEQIVEGTRRLGNFLKHLKI